MNEKQWFWYAGQGGENYTSGPHSTREEAIEAGRDEYCGEAFEIIEATQPPLRLADWLNVERAIEDAEESLSDSDRVCWEYEDDPPHFEHTPEQGKDLYERIAKACDEWQAAHGLIFKVRTFADTRNFEQIPEADAYLGDHDMPGDDR